MISIRVNFFNNLKHKLSKLTDIEKKYNVDFNKVFIADRFYQGYNKCYLPYLYNVETKQEKKNFNILIGSLAKDNIKFEIMDLSYPLVKQCPYKSRINCKPYNGDDPYLYINNRPVYEIKIKDEKKIYERKIDENKKKEKMIFNGYDYERRWNCTECKLFKRKAVLIHGFNLLQFY